MNKFWNLSSLDTTFSVKEYIGFTCENDLHEYKEPWFLGHIDMKTIAICPYCGQKAKLRIDLATIKYWRTTRDAVSIDTPVQPDFKLVTERHEYCEHAAMVDVFMHFNGVKPYKKPPEGETCEIKFGPEVPGVMAPYFAANVGLKAVMQCFPVCRIEGKRFVPVHNVYLLTYFLPDRNELQDIGKWQQWYEVLKGTRKTLFFDIYEKIEPYQTFGRILRKVDNNLGPYVERGDLYWMADNNFEEIFTHDVQAFPFKGITGRTEEIDFSDYGYGEY